jgi:hypothetical protein
MCTRVGDGCVPKPMVRILQLIGIPVLRGLKMRIGATCVMDVQWKFIWCNRTVFARA